MTTLEAHRALLRASTHLQAVKEAFATMRKVMEAQERRKV